MNDRPKRNTQAGEAPQRATSGQNVPKSGERANAGTRRRNGAGSLFGENGNGKQTEGRMRNNPYKDLPPLERRPDGTHYRMTPAQRKQANALIRWECCNCEDGDCIALDDGDTCTCPQMISFSVCCKWFRWSVLPQSGMLEAEIFREKELKRFSVCGRVVVPKSNRGK